MEQKEMSQSIQMMIATEFGFEDVGDENQKQLIEKMTESVIKRVLVDAYTKLSESDRKNFEEMMENIENIEPDSIEEFLREKLTDYDEVVNKAVEDLKKNMIDSNL
ncbi:MAG: DUF5663 domain-containing protein [Candidatus Moraniibacteriota bacterium]|jgi:molecular chaperone DnaK (HSP70)